MIFSLIGVILNFGWMLVSFAIGLLKFGVTTIVRLIPIALWLIQLAWNLMLLSGSFLIYLFIDFPRQLFGKKV